MTQEQDMVSFEGFMTIQKPCLQWNKVLSKKCRELGSKERRDMAKAGQTEKYSDQCRIMAIADETNLQMIILHVLKRFGVPEPVFQRSMMAHLQDPINLEKFKQAQMEAENGRELIDGSKIPDGPKMTRNEAIAI